MLYELENVFIFLFSFLTIREFCYARQVNRAALTEKWTGKWFPKPHWAVEKDLAFSVDTAAICDDGKENIKIDYDPLDVTDSYLFLCLEKKELFNPHINLTANLVEFVIPPSYSPPIKCINESIHYEDDIPTFGAYRLVPPKFGTYKYLPPQRWMHSIAKGAVVLLHHPCADENQLLLLKRIVKSCVYQHIISPNHNLLSSRPFALLVWGKRLEMSVVNKAAVIDFIKQHVVNKNINTSQNVENKYYDVDIISDANLITDEKDTEPCGFFN